MNQLSTIQDISSNIHPKDLIEELSKSKADGCLEISSNLVSYFIEFHEGKLIYATNSADPFERLERHLRRLNYEVKTLTNDVRNQVRLNFEQYGNNSENHNADYQAICWLVENQYLKYIEATKLIEGLINEVFETYLLLTNTNKRKFTISSNINCKFGFVDSHSLLLRCSKNLQGWQGLTPEIWSTYQRVYFFNNAYSQSKISLEEQQRLGSILKGFNFRQLAVLLNQDELMLAQKLHPLIVHGAILLREPQHPFDQLPKISANIQGLITNEIAPKQSNINTELSLGDITNNNLAQKEYKIACVDDSQTILNEMNRFLENTNLSVFTINDSGKAVMTIMRIKPDLILLDVGMPTIDGYTLCTMLRKHPLFKQTPIVIVTGNKGLIDRAKAKLSGATDYMTKPFTQSELLKMVFRYLT